MAIQYLYGRDQLENYFSVDFQPDVSVKDLIERSKTNTSKDFILLDSYLANSPNLLFQDYANYLGYKTFSGSELKKKYDDSHNNIKLLPKEFSFSNIEHELLVNNQYGNGKDLVQAPFYSQGLFFKHMRTTVDHEIFLFNDIDTSYRQYLNNTFAKQSFLSVVPRGSILTKFSKKKVDVRTYSPAIHRPLEGVIVSVSTFNLLDEIDIPELTASVNELLSNEHVVLAMFFKSDGTRIKESKLIYKEVTSLLDDSFRDDNLFGGGIIKVILVRLKEKELVESVSYAEYEIIDAIGESFNIEKSDRPKISDGSIDIIVSDYIN